VPAVRVLDAACAARPSPAYDHRQHAHGLRVLLVAVALADIVLLVVVRMQPAASFAVGAAGALLLLAGWLFGSLRVTVDRERIRVAFGPGWPARSVAIADVTAVEPVRNRWWWGWGIRLTPTGWMWNVSGLDAVLVTHARGKRLRIGTDDPAGLTQAIREVAGLAG
jgi:hypothetical protein